QGGPAVIVNQSTPSAIINWNTFNIGANERVQFNQPSSSAVALNRVVGGQGPSEIMGTLTANGRIFLINRDGILFGPGSVVNTAGFLASTHDIRNSDFMAGRYNFNIPGRPDASIINQGRITATSGGFAALVAPGVRNSGTITATLGTVALAAGNSFTLDMYGDKLITLAVNDQIAGKVIDVATGKPLKSLVTNDGKIRANGGRVELTAAAARTVVDSVINTSGVIKANSIGRRNGMIVLAAANGASKPAGAPAQTIKISGTLSAAGKRPGTKGGTILVSGEHIKVSAARVDASGRAGGGKVLIGGDWGGSRPDKSLVNNQAAKLESFAIPTATTVSVDAATTINASATERGHGGKVVLWSDAQTTFAGTILARGGAQGGDGGFVETSGHQLAFAGSVDAAAPHGAAGTLLLDPANFYIVPHCLRECAPSTMTGAEISSLLADQNVVIATNNTANPPLQHGDIFVFPLTNIGWATNNTLTFSAYRDIHVFSGATIKNTAGGNLVMRADNTGTGSGTVNFLPFARVDFSRGTGTVSIYYNPLGGANKYQNPTNYLCVGLCLRGGVLVQQPSQLTPYMLVNNAIDLTNIPRNLTGTYALGKSFSAADFKGFAPGVTFAGLFDGNGGLGINYTISDLTVALFPVIESGAMVRNLNLANVNIAATGSSLFVGALAGENRGTISDVHVLSGSVNGEAYGGIIAGGLVGENNGMIQQSSSAAAVSVGKSDTLTALSIAGGLAGVNRGAITRSSASGAVSVGANGIGGGLVAVNSGTISDAFATGGVTGAAGTGGITTLGGLVGANLGQIAGSYAGGDVGGASVANLQVGGLVGSNSGGSILSSAALGNVQAGDGSTAGGLAGFNQGTITGSSAMGDVGGGAFSVVGGLVGRNAAAITTSFATGDVVVGSYSSAGGLVGSNGPSLPSPASILDSYATGTVSSAGINVALGGLAGFNAPGSTITSSYAAGDVTSTAGVAAQSAADCSANNSCQNVSAGGLVGQNFGTIAGFTTAALNEPCTAGQTCASGTVTVGGNGTGGGLVGSNAGIIRNAFATGSVTGAAGSGSGGVDGQGGTTTLGGLAGFNQGRIELSFASGSVGTSNVANLQAGGLVGSNSGAVVSSVASGNVHAGDGSTAGGLVGSNSIDTITCTSCLVGDGAPFANTAAIGDSQASGNVIVGATSVGGGLAGTGDGTFTGSSASGAVTGGDNSVLGGFIGALTFENGPGQVTGSTASGTVTSTGSNSTIGGFVGLSSGMISSSASSGMVTGTSDSYLGGFVGVNLGSIDQSSATGSVTGSGTENVGGGFAGANFGSIDSSSASGNATSGPNSAVGGFAGANAQFVNFPADSIPGSSFPVGTITNSSASGAAGGGTGSTVAPFIALNDPTTAANPPAFPSIVAGCSAPTCVFVNTGLLPSPPSPTPPTPGPLPPFSPDTGATLPLTLPGPMPPISGAPAAFSPEPLSPLAASLLAQQAQVVQSRANTIQLAALNTAPVVNTVQGGIRLPPQQAPPPAAGQTNLPPGIDQRIIDIPPPGETRFVQDEVMVQIRADLGLDRLRAAIANLGLTILASEDLGILGSTAVRLHIDNGRSPAEVIRALAAVQLVAVAQPQYVYTLDQQASEPA
ncbi:MAG: GLUG motif-containing protein, partial [Xanthobacteraceae bacterium]